MSLKAGRAGLDAEDVDINGKLIPLKEITEKLAKIDVLESSNAGLNLFDKSRLEQGLMQPDGTDYPNTDPNNSKFVRSKGRVAVKPNTTYTFNVESSKDIVIYMMSFSSSVIGSGWNTFPYTFTTDANTNEIRFEMRTSDRIELLPSDITKIQLELGSQATDFVPSNGVSNEQLTHDVDALTEELSSKKFVKLGSTTSTSFTNIATTEDIKNFDLLKFILYQNTLNTVCRPFAVMDCPTDVFLNNTNSVFVIDVSNYTEPTHKGRAYKGTNSDNLYMLCSDASWEFVVYGIKY